MRKIKKPKKRMSKMDDFEQPQKVESKPEAEEKSKEFCRFGHALDADHKCTVDDCPDNG